jgi:hypothetical protein
VFSIVIDVMPASGSTIPKAQYVGIIAAMSIEIPKPAAAATM